MGFQSWDILRHNHFHGENDETVDFGTRYFQAKPKADKNSLEAQEERPWDISRYFHTNLGLQVFSLFCGQ